MTPDPRTCPRPAAWRRPLALLSSLALGWSCAAGAAAAEVKALVAEAFQPVVVAVTPVFEKRTGHRLVVVKDSVDQLARRIREGEEFDLAVLPPALLEALGTEGAVSDGSIIPLAKVAAGAARNATVYAGAVSTSASNSQAALSLLILLASEDTQVLLKDKGLSAP